MSWILSTDLYYEGNNISETGFVSDPKAKGYAELLCLSVCLCLRDTNRSGSGVSV
jgi:hypothetical protein